MASAKLGDEKSILFLKEHAKDPIYSAVSCQYLKELAKKAKSPGSMEP